MSKLLGLVFAALSLFAVLGLTACETSERADLSNVGFRKRGRGSSCAGRRARRSRTASSTPKPRPSSRERACRRPRYRRTKPRGRGRTEAAASAAAGATARRPRRLRRAPPVVETVLPTIDSPIGGVPSQARDAYRPIIPAMIQPVIGGMPIWLMALIGVVLLAAIALGMSGGRKTSSEA